MEVELKRLEQEAVSALAALSGVDELEPFRVRFLGRKGLLASVMRQLGQVSVEDRPRLGQLANEVQTEGRTALRGKKGNLCLLRSRGTAEH